MATPPPGSPDDPRPKSYDLIGQPAAAFALPKLGGGEARLADYGGRWLVLYFWGLWCPDCVQDGANVAKLAQLIDREPGVEFLAVHSQGRALDGSPRFGRWGSVEAYFAERGYAYPVAFDPGRSIRDAYAIKWVPSFVAIDPSGVIRAWRTDLGEDGAERFVAEIRRLVRAAR